MRAYDARMFPFRLSRIFTNRWFALLWAAGICWMALDTVGTAPPLKGNDTGVTDVTGAPVNQDDIAALQKTIEGLNKQTGQP